MLEQLSDDAEVVVIGAGAVGLWAAIRLAQRGMRVTVVDRDHIGKGASFGNAGLLTPSLSLPLARPGAARQAMRWLLSRESPFAIRPTVDPTLACWLLEFVLAGYPKRFHQAAQALVGLCLKSSEVWEEFALEHPHEFGYNKGGLIALFESDRSFSSGIRNAELTGQIGVPWEPWDRDRIRHEEPCIASSVSHAIHYPADAYAEPDRAMGCLKNEATSLGIRILEGGAVTEINHTHHRITGLVTTQGTLHADQFVIAAGAWSGALVRLLGKRIPMRSGKGYSMKIPRIANHPRRALYLADRRVTVTPHESSLRIAGTLEIGKPDLTVDRRRARSVIRSAAELVQFTPGAEFPHVWSGLRPCLSDGMPMIGRVPSFGNAWISTGHQMTGFKCAPGSADLLVALMCTEPPPVDPVPFNPARLFR